jgi:3-hydroxyisobutyrate dehydrogenase
MSVKMKIGYVGVGLMGMPMAKRLLSLGYAVRAFDISAQRIAEARDAGAAPASSAADAVRGVDLVLLNLPTPEAVEAATFGENGVASTLRPPQLLVDFSTIKVYQCKAFAQRLREMTGVSWTDAPVSGGPPASGTCRSASREAWPTACCCSACTRAWSGATSRRRATCASC